MKLTLICPICGFGFMYNVVQPSPLFNYHPLPSTKDPYPIDPQSPWICLPRSSSENYRMVAPHSAIVGAGFQSCLCVQSSEVSCVLRGLPVGAEVVLPAPHPPALGAGRLQ